MSVESKPALSASRTMSMAKRYELSRPSPAPGVESSATASCIRGSGRMVWGSGVQMPKRMEASRVSSLPGELPAVGMNDLTGDVRGPVAQEEIRHRGDLLGPAEPVHRQRVDELPVRALPFLGAAPGTQQWRVDRAGAQRIDADAIG